MLVVRILLQEPERLGEHPLDHPGRVRYEYRTQRGAHDDNVFGDLQQHHDLAVVHHVAAEHASEDDEKADDDEHRSVGQRSGGASRATL